ncbi:MAG: VOC family protein [Saprospiraceae bacterium]|nr:VOC family protein [Lewinella sp.]
MRFAHTNIISTNWKALVDFYVKTFDCKIVPPIRQQSGDWLARGTGVKDAKLEGAHLLLPGYGEHGPTLEIYQYETIVQQEMVRPNQRGFGHIAFEVGSVEVVLARLEENGGSRFGEITKRMIDGVGEITFVYARDPEGNLIELQSWK